LSSNQQSIAHCLAIRKKHEAWLMNNLPDCVSFGRRLYELRCLLDVDVPDMAYILGVGLSTYQGWEKDVTTPSLYYIHLMCLTMEVDLAVMMSQVAPTENSVPLALRQLCLPGPVVMPKRLGCPGSDEALTTGRHCPVCNRKFDIGFVGGATPRHNLVRERVAK
jgi:hypothetical protein